MWSQVWRLGHMGRVFVFRKCVELSCFTKMNKCLPLPPTCPITTRDSTATVPMHFMGQALRPRVSLGLHHTCTWKRREKRRKEESQIQNIHKAKSSELDRKCKWVTTKPKSTFLYCTHHQSPPVLYWAPRDFSAESNSGRTDKQRRRQAKRGK